jgi:2'-5' RNA ligase
MKPPSKSSLLGKRNGYAIELSFDPATEAVIRGIWGDLARAGAGDFLSMPGAHPHISFAVYDALDPAVAVPLLTEFARTEKRLPVTLSSAGVFPGNAGVVFLGVVVTEELLQFHRDLRDRLHAIGGGSWSYYEAGTWVPHCTLTQDMPDAQIPQAIEIAHRVALPLVGTLERVNLVRFRPPVILFSRPLAGE